MGSMVGTELLHSFVLGLLFSFSEVFARLPSWFFDSETELPQRDSRCAKSGAAGQMQFCK